MDRNDGLPKIDTLKLRSLSARRAWIEIVKYLGDIDWTTVALRKESVDRNANHPQTSPLYNVALRKESVDRNVGFDGCVFGHSGRSPQGERG